MNFHLEMGNGLSTNTHPLSFPPLKKDSQKVFQDNSVEDSLNYIFNDKDKTCKIIGGNNFSSSVFIPRSVKRNMQDYIITEISEGSFSNSFIQTVEFPSNSEVRIIGKEAFSESLITKIIIPQHVTEICEGAFNRCKQLNQVIFSENSELLKIGKNSFRLCAIESISIPSHVTEICEYAFSSCFQMKDIEFSNNSELKTIGKGAFLCTKIENFIILSNDIDFKDEWNYNMNQLKNIKISEKAKSQFIYSDDGKFIFKKSDPNSEDYDSLFFSQKDITEVTIPPFIKRISSCAFAFSKIEYIMIPKQVTEICSFAFSNCKELQKVEFEENSDLQIIGKYAFGCTSIESITIPKHITKISEGTFFNCEKFQEINFHDDCELKIIDKRSFGFTALQSITIPASVVELKDKWLKYVNSEDFDVKIDEKNKQFKYFEDKIIVGKTNPESEEYENLVFARRSIENLKIPPFIKRIAPFAFSECKKLESISDHNLSEFIIEKKAFYLL